MCARASGVTARGLLRLRRLLARPLTPTKPPATQATISRAFKTNKVELSLIKLRTENRFENARFRDFEFIYLLLICILFSLLGNLISAASSEDLNTKPI